MNKNLKTFNYYKKRDRKLDYFMFFQLFLVICLLTVLYSNQTIARYFKRYDTEKYANITRVSYYMLPELAEEIGLDDYNVLGEISAVSPAEIDDSNIPNNQRVCFADKYVFENFKLPLKEGRYPINEYEALASGAFKGYLQINESYNIKVWGKPQTKTIKIVGFTEGDLSYAQNDKLGIFTGIPYGVSVFVNDFTELSSHYDIITDKFIDMNEAVVDKAIKNDYSYGAYLRNIRGEYRRYEWNEQATYHAIACFTYFIIVAVVLVLLANKILYQLEKKKEVAIMFISGQSKGSIIKYKLIKNLYYFLWVLIVSLFIVIMIVNFATDFYLSYKAWGIAISYSLIVVCFISLINAITIKKQNICETLNAEN